MAANIELGWKLLTVANTLDYFDTAIVIVVKRFKVEALGDIFVKLFLPSSLIYCQQIKHDFTQMTSLSVSNSNASLLALVIIKLG